jgi:S-adenosylmethionine:tRNA ribosyltransferase-isomerase
MPAAGSATCRARNWHNWRTPGDLVIANDAATLPASLRGVHLRTGREIEVRLAGRRSLDVGDVREFIAVLFGEGDHRTPTERRPLPPVVEAGDVLLLGPLRATVLRTEGHARLVTLRFEGGPDAIWSGIARHGRPVQYAHMREPLALWDVWTRVAALPVAFEPPSAGFVLDWSLLSALKQRGVGLPRSRTRPGSRRPAMKPGRTPAAGRALPLPAATVSAIAKAQVRGGRVIALGTTVTRALEHAASRGELHAGPGLADQRIGADTRLRVVDAIISGTHEPGTSHYELLRAFAPDASCAVRARNLRRNGFRTHEFGDSVWLERARLARAHGRAEVRYSANPALIVQRCLRTRKTSPRQAGPATRWDWLSPAPTENARQAAPRLPPGPGSARLRNGFPERPSPCAHDALPSPGSTRCSNRGRPRFRSRARPARGR